jgi:putative phosphoribosyl transferase
MKLSNGAPSFDAMEADEPEAAHVRTQELVLDVDDVDLPATVAVPDRARGLVIFAHGSGSSRSSPRNLEVARALQREGIATLLFDLLTEPEAADPRARFDVPLLARRLLATARWAGEEALPRPAPLGYFGASAGAAAALIAAAQAPALVAAVVSRGGRPDLANRWLPRVAAPTLFIVGENDRAALHLNEQAAARMDAPRSLAVIPGASHLFEEPGTLREVARLAVTWFTERFSEAARRVSTGIIDHPRPWH